MGWRCAGCVGGVKQGAVQAAVQSAVARSGRCNFRFAQVAKLHEEGATTIMLRSLPASTTTSSLMTMLGLPFVGFYDFLYLPQCSRQPNRIVEMAFINFVDQSFARLAVQLFQEASTMIQSWSRTRVSQARVQGRLV